MEHSALRLSKLRRNIGAAADDYSATGPPRRIRPRRSIVPIHALTRFHHAFASAVIRSLVACRAACRRPSMKASQHQRAPSVYEIVRGADDIAAEPGEFAADSWRLNCRCLAGRHDLSAMQRAVSLTRGQQVTKSAATPHRHRPARAMLLCRHERAGFDLPKKSRRRSTTRRALRVADSAIDAVALRIGDDACSTMPGGAGRSPLANRCVASLGRCPLQRQ